MMDGKQITEWLDWGKLVFGGLIFATAWCVKLEITVSALKADMEIQKSRRDEMIARIIEKMNADHDQIIVLKRDDAWLISGGAKNSAPIAE